MSTTLVILNDPTYGSERSYNGLWLGIALPKTEGQQVRVFLLGDAVAYAKAGQKVPQGYYNVVDMLDMAARRCTDIGVCGTCVDAIGITETELAEAAKRGTMAQLAEWTLVAHKVLVF